jgi:hypothetical protein
LTTNRWPWPPKAIGFAAKPFVTAEDFAAETLIAYPVDRSPA